MSIAQTPPFRGSIPLFIAIILPYEMIRLSSSVLFPIVLLPHPSAHDHHHSLQKQKLILRQLRLSCQGLKLFDLI